MIDYEERTKKREENAKAEGKAEGREEGFVSSILEDYGDISDGLSAFISKQDLMVLKNWVKIAAKVSTVKEFEEKVGFKITERSM